MGQTARNLNIGVSRNRFCDFLADPDSRSFSRFGAIIMQFAVCQCDQLSGVRELLCFVCVCARVSSVRVWRWWSHTRVPGGPGVGACQ